MFFLQRFHSLGNHETVDEFLIPYKDIEFGEQQKSGRQCTIYRYQYRFSFER